MTSFLGPLSFPVVGPLLEPGFDLRPPKPHVTPYRIAAWSVAGGSPPIDRGLGTRNMSASSSTVRAAAGDKSVGIWGGANIMRQYLKAGLLDEMQIHLIPVLLGGGVPLFEDLDPEGIELRRTSSIETPGATHFRFELVK